MSEYVIAQNSVSNEKQKWRACDVEPRDAVAYAYAIEVGDPAPHKAPQRYADLIIETEFGFICGNWSCKK